jgi:hypothetical protein
MQPAAPEGVRHCINVEVITVAFVHGWELPLLSRKSTETLDPDVPKRCPEMLNVCPPIDKSVDGSKPEMLNGANPQGYAICFVRVPIFNVGINDVPCPSGTVNFIKVAAAVMHGAMNVPIIN